MRRGAAFLVLAAPLFPALACGGRVGGEGAGGGYDTGDAGGEGGGVGYNAGDAQTNQMCPPMYTIDEGAPCSA
jgi:hypothetical protein